MSLLAKCSKRQRLTVPFSKEFSNEEVNEFDLNNEKVWCNGRMQVWSPGLLATGIEWCHTCVAGMLHVCSSKSGKTIGRLRSFSSAVCARQGLLLLLFLKGKEREKESKLQL